MGVAAHAVFIYDDVVTYRGRYLRGRQGCRQIHLRQLRGEGRERPSLGSFVVGGQFRGVVCGAMQAVIPSGNGSFQVQALLCLASVRQLVAAHTDLIGRKTTSSSVVHGTSEGATMHLLGSALSRATFEHMRHWRHRKQQHTHFQFVLVAPLREAAVDWIAQQFVRDFERLGHHGRLVIRCDQEATLRSLVSEAARMLGEAATFSEQSAVRIPFDTASRKVL